MVLSLVGWGSQELIDDVAVCSMELKPIEACLFGELYAFLKLLLQSLDVLEGHLFRSGELFIADISDGLCDCDGGWRPRFQIIVFERVGDSSGMENL